MKVWLRDMEIAPPTFATLAEALEYGQRFQQPQQFIETFLRGLHCHIIWSAPVRYDPWLASAGSAVLTERAAAIKIGELGLVRDSELFKTLVHEEMHLRLIGKARQGLPHALELVTNPNMLIEEDYAERVAIRYLRGYERRFTRLKH